MNEEDKGLSDHQWRNLRVRKSGREEIIGLRKRGIAVKCMTPFQYRVEGTLDLYPTNRCFHNIKTHERGTYTDVLLIIRAQTGAEPR